MSDNISLSAKVNLAKYFIKVMRYSCGKVTKRVYSKATGELVDAIPVNPSQV